MIGRNPGARAFLPTVDEWVKAAYHKNDGVTGNYWEYPTSAGSAPGTDMDEATNPGNNANYYSEPQPIDPPYYTTEVGEFEWSDSPYGTFDQGGNVWEICETVVDTGVGQWWRRHLGGGWYSNVSSLAIGTLSSGLPTEQVEVLGFRIATLDPGSIIARPLLWDNGAGDNNWFNSVNWDPDGSPDPPDQLAVLTGTPHAAASDVTTDGGGSIHIWGAGTVATFDLNLVVGATGDGKLHITDGGSVVSMLHGQIGTETGSQGEVLVHGTGSAWNVADSLYVGGSAAGGGGTGTLTVQNGGTVNVANTLKVWSTGTVELLGSQINTGSLLVESGGTLRHDAGTLAVLGGTFDPGDPGIAVYAVDGPGNPTLQLTGAGANLQAEVWVADAGTGTLEITDGGWISSYGVDVGKVADSQGTVRVHGAGSRWRIWGFFQIGEYGGGTLEITGGGSVRSDTGWPSIIAAYDDSQGAVTVDGAGSTWVANDLHVGEHGTGTLTITGEGNVSTAYSGYIAPMDGSAGTVTINGTGSVWDVGNNVHVGGFSPTPGGTGELYLQDHGSVHIGNTLNIWSSGAVHLESGELSADTIDVALGGQFNFTGGTLAARTFLGSLWVGDGCTIAPGNGVGTLEITDMAMIGGTYAWELGPSGADLVAVNGFMLDLGGALTLQLLDAGAPAGPVGDLPIFTYPYLSGDELGNWTIDTSNVPHWVFAPGGPTLVNDMDNYQILLTGVEQVLQRQWNNPGGGSYHDSTNWLGGIVPNSVGAEANFLEKIEGDSTVHCEEPVVVGTINLHSPNSYTIAGPAEITLEASAGDAQINVLSGHHRIEAPLSLAGNLAVDTADATTLTLDPDRMILLLGNLTKNGLGALVLTETSPLAGDVTVNEGVLEVGENVLALGSGSNTIYLGEGSTLKAVGTVNHRVVNTGAPGTSTLEAVGVLDVGVNTLANGYDYQGALEVGPHSVGLKDLDEAELYGAHMAGGTISSFN
ncbi:MAG: hypothetical protein ACYSWU_18170, partial [Planctomycetota bacterium]